MVDARFKLLSKDQSVVTAQSCVFDLKENICFEDESVFLLPSLLALFPLMPLMSDVHQRIPHLSASR